MKRFGALALLILIVLSLVAVLGSSVSTAESPAHLMIVKWYDGRVTMNAKPSTENSETNRDYKLLGFHWYTTANYLINPSNKYGFSADAVVTAINNCTYTWDAQTSAAVFSYEGTTNLTAGTYDGYNVVSWGSYQAGVIAVTYIWYRSSRNWYRGSQILETDTMMNTVYGWSLSGESGKMDVQNIMTHEFGHWAGLNDLYADRDYWLTMYGYAGYGETYKRSLGLGDTLGLRAVYGK